MNRSEKLLKEILPGEDSGDFEKASLKMGLAHMRQERRRRLLVRAGSLVAVVAAALLLEINHRVHSLQPGSQVATVPPSAASSPVETISDEQLLSLFPGRSVALIGKPGQQQLIFLDHPNQTPKQTPF